MAPTAGHYYDRCMRLLNRGLDKSLVVDLWHSGDWDLLVSIETASDADIAAMTNLLTAAR